MPRIKYENHKFGQAAKEVIARAVMICQEYAGQGFDLTLRQLYYQFVARDWFENKQANYNRLGGIVNDARMAGYIDWDYIVDRTRNLRSLAHWDSPIDVIRAAADGYRNDKWQDQPNRVEVWIEKDALVGVLEAACQPLDVPFFSCRGYTSASEVWSAAQRLRGYIENGQKAVVLHLGDHDPSGVDMSRDIDARLWKFIATDLYQGRSGEPMKKEDAIALTDSALEIRRIALNMNQIEQYDPPPNPAKFKDPRAKKYVELWGTESWELDALPPDVLVRLIQGEIRDLRDDELWSAASVSERTDRKLLTACADRWDGVRGFLSA